MFTDGGKKDNIVLWHTDMLLFGVTQAHSYANWLTVRPWDQKKNQRAEE